MPLFVPAPVGLSLLTSQPVTTAVAAVDFTTRIDSTFEEYWVNFQNVLTTVDVNSINVRTSTDGGATFDSGASDYNSQGGTAAQVALSTLQGPTNSATYGGQSGWVRFINPAKASGYKSIFWEVGSWRYDFAGHYSGRGAHSRSNAAAINALRFFADTSTIKSGLFKLYGIRK